jgi:hypothetical protein
VLRRNRFRFIPKELRRPTDRASWLGGFATFWTAVFGVVTLIVAGITLKATLDAVSAQDRGAAYGQYADYLKLVVEHPDQTQPTAPGYPALVAHMLYSCERVLSVDDSIEWQRTCQGEIAEYRNHIEGMAKDVYCSYSLRMRELIDETLDRDAPFSCRGPL